MTSFRFCSLLLTVSLVVSSGCSKNAKTDSQAGTNVVLGVVELVYGTPLRQDLGGGSVCILRAEPMDPGNLELVSILEKSGKQVATARALPVKADQPIDISLGNVKLTLTPHIK